MPAKTQTLPIAIILGPQEYTKPFESMYECYCIGQSDPNWEDHVAYADLVVFTGGSDVDPRMYGEEKHHKTISILDRDVNEAKIFEYCKEHDIAMAGICRGAQFLTVMNGGKLVQNICNHATSRGHDITALVKEQVHITSYRHYNVTSTHHQMIYPWNLPDGAYKVLAYAKDISTGCYQGKPTCEEDLKKLVKKIHTPIQEPEVVWYPLTKSLCAQFHPEMMEATDRGFIYYQDLIEHNFLE